MKKPVVNYLEFRPGKINEPRFAHLKLLGGWIVYFALYFITENLIPAEKCHPVHCFLDDLIPFNELFVIPYVFWYVLLVGSLLYFVLYDIPNFKRLSVFIMITQGLAMAAYILWPSRQDLRPEAFLRDNILTRLMGAIYAFDTSTGVCPSLHVAYSVGIASVWAKDKEAPLWFKLVVAALAALISVSTAGVKQHSVVDIFAALPVCLVAEIAVFGKNYWLPRFRKRAGT